MTSQVFPVCQSLAFQK